MKYAIKVKFKRWWLDYAPVVGSELCSTTYLWVDKEMTASAALSCAISMMKLTHPQRQVLAVYPCLNTEDFEDYLHCLRRISDAMFHQQSLEFPEYPSSIKRTGESTT